MAMEFPGGQPTQQVLFGGRVRPMVARLLQEATVSHARTYHAEAVLWSAHALDPACLAVYYALYKFYFHQGDLAEAQRLVRRSLTEAARQCGIEEDWRRAHRASADWSDTTAPQHFYLFGLKALAFIGLRMGQGEEAGDLLDKIGELDPEDNVGAAVVRDLHRQAVAGHGIAGA